MVENKTTSKSLLKVTMSKVPVNVSVNVETANECAPPPSSLVLSVARINVFPFWMTYRIIRQLQIGTGDAPAAFSKLPMVSLWCPLPLPMYF